MSVVGTLIVKLTADSTGLNKGFSEAETKTSLLKGSMASLGQAIAGAFAAGAVISFAKDMGRFAVDFESAMAGVRKTVDATDAQFAMLEEGIRDMARHLPASALEIAGVAEAAGQLGIATDDILLFTRTMVDLGNTTNLTAEQAATALARFANITGLASDDIDRLGSTIVDLGNNFATTEAEIVDMALRIAGAGTQAGLSEKQILAFAAAMSSVGIQAELGGTAISRVFLDIQSSVAKGGKAVEGFARAAGMSIEEFSQAFRTDAAGAVALLLKRLGELPKTEALKLMEDMGMEGVRTTDVILRLANSGDLLTTALDTGAEAWAENVALQKEAGQRYETTASKMQVLSNNLKDLAVGLTEANIAGISFGSTIEGWSKILSGDQGIFDPWLRALGLMSEAAEGFSDKVRHVSDGNNIFALSADKATTSLDGLTWGYHVLAPAVEEVTRLTEEEEKAQKEAAKAAEEHAKTLKKINDKWPSIIEGVDEFSTALYRENLAAMQTIAGLKKMAQRLEDSPADWKNLADHIRDTEEALVDLSGNALKPLTLDIDTFGGQMGESFSLAAGFVRDFTGTAQNLLSASGPWGMALSGAIELAEAFGLDFNRILSKFFAGGTESSNIMSAIRAAFEQIANASFVLGDSFDRAEAEIRVLEDALIDMLNKGVDPTSPSFIQLSQALALAREGAMLASEAFAQLGSEGLGAGILLGAGITLPSDIPEWANDPWLTGEAWEDLADSTRRFNDEAATAGVRFGEFAGTVREFVAGMVGGGSVRGPELGGFGVTTLLIDEVFSSIAEQMEYLAARAAASGESFNATGAMIDLLLGQFDRLWRDGFRPGDAAIDQVIAALELYNKQLEKQGRFVKALTDAADEMTFSDQAIAAFTQGLEGMRDWLNLTGSELTFWEDAMASAVRALADLQQQVQDGTVTSSEAAAAFAYLNDFIAQAAAMIDSLEMPRPPAPSSGGGDVEVGGGTGGGTGGTGTGGGVIDIGRIRVEIDRRSLDGLQVGLIRPWSDWLLDIRNFTGAAVGVAPITYPSHSPNIRPSSGSSGETKTLRLVDHNFAEILTGTIMGGL